MNEHANNQHKQAEDAPETPPYRMHRGRIAVLVILSILPILLVAAAQPFLPDSVPLHYNASFNPDQWGPKSELFLLGSIVAVLSLILTAIYTVLEHQRETGREDWLVIDGPTRSLFPLTLGFLIVMIAFHAVYVFAAFQPTSFTIAPDSGRLILDLLFGLTFLAILLYALFMLITGKGLSAVTFHPTRSNDHDDKNNKQQARALGGLLLFIALLVFTSWMILR